MRFRWWNAVAMIALSAVSACSEDSDGASTSAGCSRDVDCPGTQICESRRCVAADASSGGVGGGSGGSAGGSGGGAGVAQDGAPGGAGGSADAGDAGRVACTADAECSDGMMCIALSCRPPGSCVGSEAGIEAQYDIPDADGGTRRVSARDVARQCGVDCLLGAPAGATEEDLAECTHSCILELTDGNISTACAYCFVESVGCGRQNCLTQCIDPQNLNCVPCLCGENNLQISCVARFEACGGVSVTTCDASDAG